MKKIRVLIADDHQVVRIGLTSLLGSEDDIEIAGSAKNGEEAVRLAAELNPDVVIMDIVMPRLDGVEATRRILQSNNQTISNQTITRVLILTSFGTSDGIAHALEAGASGALMKDCGDEEIVAAVRRIAAGGKAICRELKRSLAENPPAPELTGRQREIVTALAEGLSSKELSDALGLSVPTVNEHITSIMEKLGASNRTEAVAIAMKKQLVKI